MGRKIAYWVATGLIAAMSLFAAFAYLSGSPQAVEGFAHVGYPQQLRVILGVAKLLGAITLLVPAIPRLKEWAYAGFAITLVSAVVAHVAVGDGIEVWSWAVVTGVLLAISYLFSLRLQTTSANA